MAEVRLDGITKIFPGHAVAVDGLSLTVHDGEFMVLVGPSGCGKSTVLRIIAGLEDATDGSVAIGGEAVDDLPPKSRDVAMVFQNYALYPHMTVAENLGFAMKLRHVPREQVRDNVATTADVLGLTDLLERKPRALSGGQRQRVAMGRALVRRPRVFLMDEPLSNLDAKLRVSMRAELSRLHREYRTTTIYVTHDQVEAMTLGDRIAVLDHGRLQQVGTPDELYFRPANLFVAVFLGSPAMNLARAEVKVDPPTLAVAAEVWPLPAAPADRVTAHGSRRVVVGLRPDAFSWPAEPGEPALTVTAIGVESLGDERHVLFPAVGQSAAAVAAGVEASDGEPAEDLWTAKVSARCPVAIGERIVLGVKLDDVYLFDPDTGLALPHTGTEPSSEPLAAA
jgi:multiple sugar transport system ATP-binding protein